MVSNSDVDSMKKIFEMVVIQFFLKSVQSVRPEYIDDLTLVLSLLQI